MNQPGFLTRLGGSLGVFFRFLFDAAFAARVLSVSNENALPAPALPKASESGAGEPKPAPPPLPAAPAKQDQSAALHLLATLQREGRFVDFLQEDIGSFADADVGAAARVVHDGCRRVLADYFTMVPIRSEGEGARVTVPAGFDPGEIRLTGQVAGNPPFSGALRHHGWKATDVRLPALPSNMNAAVIAPAEVEL